MRIDNTSGTIGIHWNKTHKKWIVNININSNKIYLGYRISKKEACILRNEYIDKHNLLNQKIPTEYIDTL